MNIQFVILRNTDYENTAAIVTATVESSNMTADQFKGLLNAALHRWFTETDEGRHEWEMSCQDFNVGDLASANYGANTMLGQLLTEQGISNLNINTLSAEKCAWSFDSVLGNMD